MGDYRHIDTGEIKTQGQWRSHYKNVSLPRTRLFVILHLTQTFHT